MVEALMLAHKEIKRLCLWQKELCKALEITKREFVSPQLDEELCGEVERNYGTNCATRSTRPARTRSSSYAAVDALKKEVVESYPEDDQPEKRSMAGKVFGAAEREDLPRRHARQPPPPRRPQILRDPPDHLRSRLAAACTRIGAVHPR